MDHLSIKYIQKLTHQIDNNYLLRSHYISDRKKCANSFFDFLDMAPRPREKSSVCCTTRVVWRCGRRGTARRSCWRTACRAPWSGRRPRRRRSWRRASPRPTRANTCTTCSNTPSWPRTRSTCVSSRKRSARVAESVRTARAIRGRRPRPAAAAADRARRTGGCPGDRTPCAERRETRARANEFFEFDNTGTLWWTLLFIDTIFVISDTRAHPRENFRRGHVRAES